LEGVISTEMPGQIAQAIEEIVARKVLAARDPHDAIGIGTARFTIACERGSEHGFADTTHALHPDTCIGAGDYPGILKVHEQGIAHAAHQIRTRKEMRWQRRHSEEGAEFGNLLAEAGDELRERGGVSRVVAEIFAVEQAISLSH
jgi:hypothetical protein